MGRRQLSAPRSGRLRSLWLTGHTLWWGHNSKDEVVFQALGRPPRAHACLVAHTGAARPHLLPAGRGSGASLHTWARTWARTWACSGAWDAAGPPA